MGYFKTYKEINYKLLIFVTFTAICFFLQTLLQKKIQFCLTTKFIPL